MELGVDDQGILLCRHSECTEVALVVHYLGRCGHSLCAHHAYLSAVCPSCGDTWTLAPGEAA